MAAKRSSKKKKGRSGIGFLVKLLLIGLAIVFFSFLGLIQAVRSGVFGELPSDEELRSIRHEQATMVLAYDGTPIGKIFAKDRTNVQFKDLPKHLVNALVSTEDARFFAHQGVDGRSYIRVFFRTLLGGDRSGGGGSTISQQIMKNLYGRQRHGALTIPVNKVKEALMAQRLERVLTKEDVLLLYFNSVPFGENVFGIGAASQRFFNKPVQQLKVEEGAVLVGMLKANTTYNPRLRPENARKRRNVVLALMHENGHLKQTEKDSLQKLPVLLNYSGGDIYDNYGYYVAVVADEARSILKELEEKSGTQYNIEKDGLRINTTLDPALQNSAIKAIRRHLASMQPRLDRELRAQKSRSAWEKRIAPSHGAKWKDSARQPRELYDHRAKRVDTLSYRDSLWHYEKMLNGAVLMMDPSTGAVRAWVGGNDHRFLPYDLVRARRPIASTIKPAVYASALERGFDPCTYFDNEKRTYAQFEDWSPDNYDRDTTAGEVAMWYSLAKSMNRPTVDLYFKTGQDTIRRTFNALGLPSENADKPAIALGAEEISLLEIVPAYGSFAMRGKRVQPQLITSITDQQGKVIYKADKPKVFHALNENSAAQITAMLQKAIDEGTGTALRSKYNVTSPLAGKTGTSQNYGDAWFVAYTPGLVIGTWVGAFDPEIHFNSSAGTGTQLAMPIAAHVLNDIEAKAKLRKRYLLPFDWLSEHDIDMNCDPKRYPNVLERFFDNVFGPKKLKDPNDTAREKKDRGFFDRLFKKKN